MSLNIEKSKAPVLPAKKHRVVRRRGLRTDGQCTEGGEDPEDAGEPSGRGSKKKKLQRELPEEFINFDRLPDAAYVRQPVVELLYACSGATVWRYVKQGIIIPPEKFGRNIAWNVGKLRRARETSAS